MLGRIAIKKPYGTGLLGRGVVSVGKQLFPDVSMKILLSSLK